MVRRRRTEKSSAKPGKARPVNRKDASVKKWDKYTDIPMDDEDEFHENRDHILLNEGNKSVDDDDMDDEEVFALKGIPESSSEDSEVEDADADAESSTAPATKKSKKKSQKRKPKSSDEEGSESSEDEHWGSKKSIYYSSNAAQLESDDEEGNELELQEAKRIQAKILENLCDDDYGLSSIPDKAVTLDSALDSFDDFIDTEHQLPTDKPSILRHLEKTDPEALALARDWNETAKSVLSTKAKIATIQADEPDSMGLGMLHLYYQTLVTYATTLAFYFHLRSMNKYARRPELLRSHPILSRLLTLKQSLATLEQLDFAPSDDEDDLDDSESDDLDFHDDAQSLWQLDKLQGLEADELADLLGDANMEAEPVEQEEPETAPRPKKKRKTGKKIQADGGDAVPIFDVAEPDFSAIASSSKVAARQPDATDTYGEASSLEHSDLVDKAAKKKSLRFYTSKLDSTTARRQAARSAISGDDDIPYRERRKERESRESGELEKRLSKLGQGGADLDDVEPGARTEDMDTGDAGEEYYKLIEQQSKAQKVQKKAVYDEAVEGARQLDYEMGDDSVGQRALTRAILKNKGLTPRRPKSVRNPRVKKRQKFEKAKRTVSSQKAVYKGGLTSTGGRYDGEKTGISKVAKGIKLG